MNNNHVEQTINEPINDDTTSEDETTSEEVLSDSDDESVTFNEEDFVLHNFEKDLEVAIHLSLKHKQNVEEETCIVCFDKKITTAFIPCGHLCCCYDCAHKCNKKCPMCRKKNKTIQKIYTI